MNRLSKILTIQIIILLISVSAISTANNINNDELLIENPKDEQLNDQTEIISYIRGTSFYVDKTGFINNEPVKITPWKTAIFIIGIKIPTLNSYNLFFYDYPNSIIRVSCFFGNVIRVNEYQFEVYGFAIGDIELE